VLLAGCQRLPAQLSVTPVPAETAAVTTGKPLRPAPLTGFAGGTSVPEVLSGRLIVSLAPKVAVSTFKNDPATAGFTVVAEVQLSGRSLLKVRVPEGLSLDEAKVRLERVNGVQRASEDYRARPAAYSFTQPDTNLGSQWAHSPTFGDTLNAWDKVPVASQSKVIVAILDTGMDVTHPEFAGRVVGAKNFTTGADPDNDVTDDNTHGTHVAGIVGAAGDNGIGVAGVAWGARLMPVKVLGGQAGGFDVVQGLLYAARYRPNPDNGARVRVINMSLGSASGTVDAFYSEAIAEARAAGVLVVVATGNDGRNVVSVPANSPGALAVGSTGNYLFWESLSPFTNYGDRLDITAPGEDIVSTVPVGAGGAAAAYGLKSGTSMACPYVSGVAALVTAKYDANNQKVNATFVEQVRQRLMRAVDDLGVPGRDPSYGEGRLNAARAVTPATLEANP
jgi:subtilisin family serine protease